VTFSPPPRQLQCLKPCSVQSTKQMNAIGLGFEVKECLLRFPDSKEVKVDAEWKRKHRKCSSWKEERNNHVTCTPLRSECHPWIWPGAATTSSFCSFPTKLSYMDPLGFLFLCLTSLPSLERLPLILSFLCGEVTCLE
jgi:hypothetical protein